MNKSYYISNGLYLPFRFYDDRNKISEASDYARQIHIPRTEYLLMPYGTILPFQVLRQLALTKDYQLSFFCLDTGIEYDVSVEHPDIADYFTTVTRSGIDHISFLGVDPTMLEITIPKGGYYAVFTDGISTWYSENIRVTDEDDVVTETYRKWSDSDTDIRTTDGSTLRII